MASSDPAPGPTIPMHDLLDLRWQMPPRGEGWAEVAMPVAPPAFGPTGALHGGAIATMVDLACAVAAVSNSEWDGERHTLVTTDMHVRYLGSPRTDTVVARAEVVRAGSQLIVLECKVRDDGGHLIAAADFSMMLVPRRGPAASGDEGTELPAL